MNSFDELLEASKSVIKAYSKMGKEEQHMPEGVKHSVTEDDTVRAHSFKTEDSERVHEHLVGKGFKQSGASHIAGPSTETRYVHPETKQVAYIGRNSHTSWLDIQK